MLDTRDVMSMLGSLVCCCCGEMLEDAVTFSDGRRSCPACVCWGCSDAPFRFVDHDNDDQQLCVECVRIEVTR